MSSFERQDSFRATKKNLVLAMSRKTKPADPSPDAELSKLLIQAKDANLPAVWPYPEIQDVVEQNSRGEVVSVYESSYVTPRGQYIRKSLASAFHWDSDEVRPESVYNAAQPDNPFHTEWLAYNNDEPKEYVPPSIPLNLQLASEQGIDLTSPSSFPEARKKEKYGSTECAYWPLGTCRNGESCRFLHPPEKAPETLDIETVKARMYVTKECAYWPQGLCRNRSTCKFLHPPEKAPDNQE